MDIYIPPHPPLSDTKPRTSWAFDLTGRFAEREYAGIGASDNPIQILQVRPGVRERIDDKLPVRQVTEVLSAIVAPEDSGGGVAAYCLLYLADIGFLLNGKYVIEKQSDSLLPLIVRTSPSTTTFLPKYVLVALQGQLRCLTTNKVFPLVSLDNPHWYHRMRLPPAEFDDEEDKNGFERWASTLRACIPMFARDAHIQFRQPSFANCKVVIGNNANKNKTATVSVCETTTKGEFDVTIEYTTTNRLYGGPSTQSLGRLVVGMAEETFGFECM